MGSPVVAHHRAPAHPRISVRYGTELAALHGQGALSGVIVRVAGIDQPPQAAAAVFVMVGAAPDTGWVQDHVALDRQGFVLTWVAADPVAGAASPHATSAPGIFAVGDVRAGSVKRVASAVGEGSVVNGAVWAHVNSAG